MTNRIIYELTDFDISALVSAAIPAASGGPMSERDSIKVFWAAAGDRMGFDPDTMQAVQDRPGHFSAVPLRPTDRIQSAQAEEAKIKANIVRLKMRLIRALHILREVADDGND